MNRLALLCILLTPSLAFAQDAEPEADEQAEVIEVETSSRGKRRLSEAPVATEIIDREHIERSGSKDLGEVLEEHHGVQIERRQRGGQTIRMQGLDGKYVLLLIDGQRTVGRLSQQNDLSRVAAEDIDHVEIVRGPSSALYGADAVGGVINVITRRSREPFEARLLTSYGMRNTFDLGAHVAFQQGPVNGRFSGGWHRGEAYDLDPATPSFDGAGYSAVHGGTMFNFDVGESSTLRLGAAYTIRNEISVDENNAGAIFDRETLAEIFDALASARMRLGETTTVSITTHFTLHRYQRFIDQRLSDALDEYEDTQETRPSFNAQVDQTLFEDHILTVGTDVFHQRLHSELRLPEPHHTGTRDGFAIYLQDEWYVFYDPLFAVVPGVRLDVDSQYDAHPTPKLALRFDPHETLALRASYGWGFRAPDFEELLLLFENPSVGYRVVGNPELQPETSMSVNAGAEWQPHDVFGAGVNFFRNDVDDLIQTESIDDGSATGTQVFGYVNIAQAWTMGVESLLRLKPVKGLSLDVGYVLTASQDVALERELEGVALHRATWQLGYRYRAPYGFGASLRGQVVGPRPFYSDPDGDGIDLTEESATFATLDARIAVDLFSEHLSLFVGVDNIIDAGESRFLPIPPRTFYGGVEGRYPGSDE